MINRVEDESYKTFASALHQVFREQLKTCAEEVSKSTFDMFLLLFVFINFFFFGFKVGRPEVIMSTLPRSNRGQVRSQMGSKIQNGLMMSSNISNYSIWSYKIHNLWYFLCLEAKI